MKSFLTFLKWTKINVQNRVAKIVLTDEKFLHDIEFLWCQIKPEKFFCDCKILFFFAKSI
jgi:hypothetical protein